MDDESLTSTFSVSKTEWQNLAGIQSFKKTVRNHNIKYVTYVYYQNSFNNSWLKKSVQAPQLLQLRTICSEQVLSTYMMIFILVHSHAQNSSYI